MRRLLGRWPATLLMTMLGAGSALADTTVGAWTVGPYEGTLPTRCVATNASDENGGVLIGMVADLGVIQFVVKSPRLRLSRDDKVEAEVLIDGRSIALSAVTTLDSTSARFEGLARGREDGSLLRGVERGARAVVQMTGQRFTFDLAGTSKAMALLSRCVIDPSEVASPTVAERDLEAADDMPDEGDGDAEASVATPGALSAQRDTTDKFEQLLVDKAKEAAGWAKPSAGAATADDSTSADALGRAMQDVTTDATPVAQFQCEVASDDLFGLRGLGSGRYQAPTAMTITVGEDGRALINGKTLEPVKVARRASLRSDGYSARDVLRATLGSVGTRAPLYGMTAEQLEAYQFATNAFAGVSVDLVGANRFMVVGVASGVVSFLDVESDGSITNQRTPVCLKTQ